MSPCFYVRKWEYNILVILLIPTMLWRHIYILTYYLFSPEHRGRGIPSGDAIKLGDAIEAHPGGGGADDEHWLGWNN